MEFSKFKDLFRQCDFYGVRLDPKVLYAQAVLETGWFTSRVYMENKNMFGMNHPRVRNTVSIGKDQSGYAIYLTEKDSLQDLILRHKYFGGNTLNDLLTYLKFCEQTNYSTDPLYTEKVVQVYESLVRRGYDIGEGGSPGGISGQSNLSGGGVANLGNQSSVSSNSVVNYPEIVNPNSGPSGELNNNLVMNERVNQIVNWLRSNKKSVIAVFVVVVAFLLLRKRIKRFRIFK